MEDKKKNQFIFLFIMALMCAVMYCMAFHSERDKVRKLEQQIETIKDKK
jgi:preprotein translocase subunit YajC